MPFLTVEEEDIFFQGTRCPEEELYKYLPDNRTVMEVVRVLLENKFADENNNKPYSPSNITREIESVLNSGIISAIVIFGIIGNVLNLVILSHRSWQVSLGRMERFVQSGLIALAVSDMCFCLTVLPLAFIDEHDIRDDYLGFKLIYIRCCEGIINTFVICSTMLTVTIAVGRYFATVHPIRAREKFGMTFAKTILTIVFIACIIINIPRYWFKKLRIITCLSDGSKHYYIYNHGLSNPIKTAYLCLYFIFAICVPFVILAYCNIFLVKALRQSVSSPIGRRRSESKHEQGSYRITLSLVIIVLAFFILVVPSETVTFWKNLLLTSGGNPDKYNIMLAIFKCLQAINFAFNFVLYCIVNAHFRRTIQDLVGCKLKRLAKRPKSFHYESATMSTGQNGNIGYSNHQFSIHVQSSSKTSPRRTSITEL